MSATTLMFRVDADSRIGYGHLSRCLALAEVHRTRGGRSCFMTRGLRAAEICRRERHEVDAWSELDLAPGQPLPANESAALCDLARRYAADWLVVDHYGAGEHYLEELCGEGWRLALLDDLPTARAGSADLVINPSAGATPEHYRLREDAISLTGPRYAPLRPLFTDLRSQSLKMRGGPLKRVLIVMGGADTAGRTPWVIEELFRVLPTDTEIHAVVGPMAWSLGDFADMSRQRLVFHQGLEPAALAQKMIESQVAIAPASTVLWELATLGVPTVILPTADNQALTVLTLTDLGGSWVVEPGRSPADAFPGPGGLSSETVRLRSSRACAALNDGRGAERILDAMARIDGSGGAEVPVARSTPVAES